MYTVQWCDYEGNKHDRRKFDTLEDAQLEKEYLDSSPYCDYVEILDANGNPAEL